MTIVFGVVSDKDLTSILPLLPKKAHYYFCAPNISRALPVEDLNETATGYGLKGSEYHSVSEALQLQKIIRFKTMLFILEVVLLL